MAHTSLSNIIVPSLFAQYVAEEVSVKSALISSGAVMVSDQLNALCGESGEKAQLPNFNELAYTDPDIAKDTSDAAAINAVSAGKQVAHKDFLSKTWGTTTLTNTQAGVDIVDHIVKNVVAPYWAQGLQKYALTKIGGVIADNLANDNGDMIVNKAIAASAAASTITDANKANYAAIIAAKQSMGDAMGKLSLIAMHSVVFSNLMLAEPGNFAPVSETKPFVTYNGLAVIIDDSLPAVLGTHATDKATTYTTYLMGAGALLMGESEPQSGAVDVKFDPLAGNGFGAETLTSRKQVILHPRGFESKAAAASNFGSPTLVEYAKAASWDRVFSRKNIPLVALQTNG